VCRTDPPPELRVVAPDQRAACHFSEELLAGTIKVTRSRAAEDPAVLDDLTSDPVGEPQHGGSVAL
jgi:hypothetical protein